MSTDTQRIERYGQLGNDACQIVALLKGGTPGELITDDVLTIAIGKDTRPGMKGNPSLMSAIRYVAEHFSVVWKREPKADAIKCLTSSEIVGVGRSAVRSIRKKSRRTAVQLSSVDLGTLPEHERSSALTLSAVVGTIGQFSETGTIKKLEARAVATVPDVSGMLSLWK